MAEYKGFPVNDGRVFVDFTNDELIKKSIIQCSNYNRFDCFINAVITVYLKIKSKKLIGNNISMTLTHEDISNLNNKQCDPTDDPITVKISIDDNLVDTVLDVKIKDYYHSPTECFKLIDNYDIDLQRRGKARKIILYDTDATAFEQSSDSLPGAILGAYFQLINRPTSIKS